MRHVFIDPGGIQEYGLLLIVEAPTGVTYQQQCGGLSTEQNKTEGFLIPLGSQAEADIVYDWFSKTFNGNCFWSRNGSPWTPETTAELKALLAEIYCYYTENDAEEAHALLLDEARMDECIEAWIPVISPYGKAILTLKNSD